MVNTATEVAPRDDRIAERANRYRERIRDGIAAALGCAAARGELPPEDVEDITSRARILQAALYGVQVAARCGATEEALATVDALERQVEQWAIPPAHLTDGS
jgi:hypothetical protein